jgi:isopentenyl-diphosphate delta-isomerase
MEEVILVDENDNQMGRMEKLAAHRKGLLHRAFSIFVFHPDGRLMLQKRAGSKYHSGGLWTNTCCGHPRPGEDTLEAAHRRLAEEMGFDCPLLKVHSLIYKTSFPNGLTEHEYDHMLVGVWDGNPSLNPEEAEDWRLVSPDSLRTEIALHPESYTYWLRISFENVLEKMKSANLL